MTNLNSVETKFKIESKQYHFVHLKLHQSFNKHHFCEIKVDFEQLDSIWMENPIKIIKLIGLDLSIEMTHLQTGETNLFKGIITNVSMNGNNGEENYITITGASPTIKLEDTPSMNSFSDLTLDLIVKEAIDKSGNATNITINTKYKSTIDYIAQYNENCFQFLNRLSWLYGEWFFFDGTTFYFGKPKLDDVIKITYDQEITHFNLSANLIPANVNRYEYLNHQDNEVISSTPYRVDGVRGYIKASLDRSEEVYTSNAILPLDASINSKKDLDDLILVDKYRRVSQMLILKATTKTCNVKIGRLLSVNLPNSMRTTLKHVETFLVTEVLHEAHQDGSYTNSFTGIPSEMEYIPMDEVKAPVALSQIAWVTSNADARGRVKVEFQWQKKLNKTTNWIRVQTPDAGSSDEVVANRGFVFIPEKGDQVMINFEKGDPDRPYVSGSIFKENTSKGGLLDNHIKSIKTRSGIEIVFDDDQRSLHIEDPSGNTWDMDGQGNISVFAPNRIKFESEYIDIMATKDLNIEVAKQMTTNVYGQTYLETPLLKQNITDYLHTFGGQVLINSQNDIRIESAETYLVGERKLFAHSAESAIVNSGGTTQIIGADGTNHTNIASKYDSVKEKIEPKCIVSFRPHSQYNAEFGFDWFRMGDSGLSEDNPFKDIIGKIYEVDGETVLIDTNSYKGIFKQDQQMYEKALRDYKNMVVAWKSTPDDVYLYSPPYLSLLEGKTAKLKLVLDIEEVPTDAITFEFEDKTGSDYFSLNVSEIKKANLKKGNYSLDAYLSITAVKECNKQQVLLAKTDDKVCGKVFIHANSKEYHKPIKTVFIKVETDITGEEREGTPIEGGYDFFKDCLHQAFVIPQNVCELAKLNCKSDPEKSQFELRDTFCSKTAWDDYYLHLNRNTWQWELKEYLERVTVEQHGDKYDSYYRVYFLGEYLSKIGGFAFFNTQFGIYFANHSKSDLAHELFHAMGLPHTFDGRNDNAKYTYKGVSTDNILDYTHLIGTNTKTLFGWQMRLLNPKIGLLNLTENSDTKNVEYEK